MWKFSPSPLQLYAQDLLDSHQKQFEKRWQDWIKFTHDADKYETLMNAKQIEVDRTAQQMVVDMINDGKIAAKDGLDEYRSIVDRAMSRVHDWMELKFPGMRKKIIDTPPDQSPDPTAFNLQRILLPSSYILLSFGKFDLIDYRYTWVESKNRILKKVLVLTEITLRDGSRHRMSSIVSVPEMIQCLSDKSVIHSSSLIKTIQRYTGQSRQRIMADLVNRF